MIYKFKTKKALKFWLWVSCAVDALLFCLFSFSESGDVKIAVFGVAAMVLQIIHGVRVAFFNRTLVNMSLGFCKFQFWLLLLFSLAAAGSLGGTYGAVILAAAVLQLAVSLAISKRREIVAAVRDFLIV